MTDVIMAEINGLELANALIAQQPRLKVLFVSGYIGEIIADRGILHAEVAFRQKPFAQEALLERVWGVLNASADSEADVAEEVEDHHLT